MDSARRLPAVATTLQILQKVDELSLEFVRRGLPEIGIGVGVNWVEHRLDVMQDADSILCEIYLLRINKLRHGAVPENWDGAFQHETK